MVSGTVVLGVHTRGIRYGNYGLVQQTILGEAQHDICWCH